MYRSYRIFIPFILIALLLSACQPVLPATPAPLDTPLPSTPSPKTTSPPPEKILLIGNSAIGWGFVDQHLARMAAFSEPPLMLDVRTSVHDYWSLRNHWDTGLALKEIQIGGWDAIVLQENSSEISEGEFEGFYEYVSRFDQEIEKVGALAVLFMPWQHLKGDWNDTDGIVAAHRHLEDELGVTVAPVGLAWKRAAEQRPELNLYDESGANSSNLGTYLTVMVLFSTLFERSPVGHPYRLSDFYPRSDAVAPANKELVQQKRDELFISEEDVEFLQRIAWETVQEYQTR